MECFYSPMKFFLGAYFIGMKYLRYITNKFVQGAGVRGGLVEELILIFVALRIESNHQKVYNLGRLSQTNLWLSTKAPYLETKRNIYNSLIELKTFQHQ